MPRLLSNVSPNKNHAKVNVEKTKEKSPQKIFNKFVVTKSMWPEENMTSWEYYNHIMRFGKRKMEYGEWVIWKMIKDREDIKKKGYVEEPPKKKMSSAECNWRFKKDPDFVDAREEFGLGRRKTWDF